MSSAATTRSVLRQSRLFFRQQYQRQSVRQASTTEQTAQKAKETAQSVKETSSSTVSRAQEGLSRVTSSAGPAISNAASSAGTALRKIGGRTGRLISFVDSIIPPTVYYSRVGLELAKLVFKGQKMTPPNLSTIQSYYQPFINSLRNPRALLSQAGSQVSNVASTYSPEALLNSIRNINRQQLATIGVVGAEVIGFFTVGTMIGRMKIVGYRGEPEHGHH